MLTIIKRALIKGASRADWIAFQRLIGPGENKPLTFDRFRELIDAQNRIDTWRKLVHSRALEGATMMSPTALIPNPGGVDGLGPSVGGHYISAINGESSATILLNALVQMVTPFNSAGTPPQPFLVKRSATTADFLLLGIALGPLKAGISSGYPVGSEIEVAVLGHALATFDANNTTAGHLALQSTATVGECTDSATATLGQTIGVVLNTVTLGAAGLVDIFVQKM